MIAPIGRKRSKYPKSDIRHWLGRIHKPTKGIGKGHDWASTFSVDGERHCLSLQTSDQQEAAEKARERYLYLRENRWLKFWQKYRPNREKNRADQISEEDSKVIPPSVISNSRIDYPNIQIDASRAVQEAIAEGRLIKEPCVACNRPVVEAHHADYSQPLKVVFLCSEHHLSLHRLLKQRFFDLKYPLYTLAFHDGVLAELKRSCKGIRRSRCRFPIPILDVQKEGFFDTRRLVSALDLSETRWPGMHPRVIKSTLKAWSVPAIRLGSRTIKYRLSDIVRIENEAASRTMANFRKKKSEEAS